MDGNNCKSLRPLPEEWLRQGYEERMRHRYLDLFK